MRFSHARRGFTLIELASVLAVAGIVTALGVAGVRSMIEAEQTRNTATQLAMDVRRHRMQAIQKQMYSRIEVASTADGVDIAYHATRTTSSPTTSPCTDMAAGVVKVGDVFEHRFYPRITATLTAVDGATTSTTTSACFTQRGLPVNDAATAYLQLALAAESSAGGPALNLEIDSNGNLASSDQTQNKASPRLPFIQATCWRKTRRHKRPISTTVRFCLRTKPRPVSLPTSVVALWPKPATAWAIRRHQARRDGR